MRIQELHLTAFGPFSARVLDLSRGKEGLHIIFGPNESGKSSSLRALHQVLYGIPVKSTDNFKHAHPDLRIGIVLKHSDGSVLRVVRRKGNSKTLRRMDAESEVVEQADLQRYLGNINQATFENMFGIDHPTLVSGGEAILKGSGELGQLLFSAGAGIADLRSVLAGLEKDYQDLYTRNGSSRVINRQLSEYAEAKRVLRECELPNSEWERHDLSLRQAMQRKEQIDRNLIDLQKQLSKLRRLRDAIPLIAERALYDAQMPALSGVVSLSENFEDSARALLEQVQMLRREDEQDSKKLSELNTELSGLEVPRGIIEKALAIESLQQKLGSHQKAALDRLSLEQGSIEEQERARACLRDLGRSEDFASASTLRISVQEKTRLRKLALERRALWQAYSDAQALRQRTEQRLRHCSQELGKLAQLPACEKLLFCYKRIQQDPQLEERCIAETNKLERNFKQLIFDLRKLQLKEAGEDNCLQDVADLHGRLQAVLSPDLHVIDRFEREFSQLQKEMDAISSRGKELSSELNEIKYRLQEHELKTAAPTESDLFEMRKLRDRGWKLIVKSWREKQEESGDISDFLKSADASSDLASAYEWASAKSDTLADRLRHEADHVALKIQLIAQVQKLTTLLSDVSEKLSSRENRLSRLQEQWSDLWSAITDRQLNPSAARLWLTQFEAVKQSLSVLLENIETGKFNKSLVVRAKAELVEALKESGWPVSEGGSPLLNLVEQAQQCLENYRAQKQSQTDLEKELSKLQIDLTNYSTTEQTRKSEIDLWAASWQPAVEALGLSATTSPEELTAFLDRLEQFFLHFDQISNLRRRIGGIDRDAEQFGLDVSETVSKVAGNLSTLSPEEAAIKLFDLLKVAKEKAQRQSLLKERRDELVQACEARKDAIEKLADRLAQMMAEASVTSEDSLLDAAKKSAQKKRLEEVLDSYNRQLIRLADGGPLEAYIEECRSHSLDDLEFRIERLSEEIKQAETERDELQVTTGSEKQILQSMDGSANAADAASRLQQILAGLGQDAEQYGRLRIASVILKKAIDRYREKNQSPILRRASDIFARLSSGSFTALQEDFSEKGEPVLFGVRAGSASLVPIEGMSEGTCDQVYLALRLAGLSIYLEKEEALPFIVDDILVNFDEKRSLATLRVLSELSRRTQIIMFTHHAHIVDLAQEHLDPEHVFFNSLSDTDAPSSFRFDKSFAV